MTYTVSSRPFSRKGLSAKWTVSGDIHAQEMPTTGLLGGPENNSITPAASHEFQKARSYFSAQYAKAGGMFGQTMGVISTCEKL